MRGMRGFKARNKERSWKMQAQSANTRRKKAPRKLNLSGGWIKRTLSAWIILCQPSVKISLLFRVEILFELIIRNIPNIMNLPLIVLMLNAKVAKFWLHLVISWAVRTSIARWANRMQTSDAPASRRLINTSLADFNHAALIKARRAFCSAKFMSASRVIATFETRFYLKIEKEVCIKSIKIFYEYLHLYCVLCCYKQFGWLWLWWLLETGACGWQLCALIKRKLINDCQQLQASRGGLMIVSVKHFATLPACRVPVIVMRYCFASGIIAENGIRNIHLASVSQRRLFDRDFSTSAINCLQMILMRCWAIFV